MNLDETRALASRGGVIPAMPLALDPERQLDTRHQRALIRYYGASGCAGIAVGVHTTQFAIRNPTHRLFETVLQFCAEEIERLPGRLFRIAGVCGPTNQAIYEASFARDRGYDAVLLSLGGLNDATIGELTEHCRKVAAVMPVFGFYLQPAVGGRRLSYAFWRSLMQIPELVAVKAAPFDRYATIDVLRAIVDGNREQEVFAYTGNDDTIVSDLLSRYTFTTPRGRKTIRFVGGLLGQWSVWTQKAVELFNSIAALHASRETVPMSLLDSASALTDANAAIFDAANGFAGCIPGIHEVLFRAGLLGSTRCLDPAEVLSPGQREEIERVLVSHPELSDRLFVEQHRDSWLEA